MGAHYKQKTNLMPKTLTMLHSGNKPPPPQPQRLNYNQRQTMTRSLSKNQNLRSQKPNPKNENLKMLKTLKNHRNSLVPKQFIWPANLQKRTNCSTKESRGLEKTNYQDTPL